jgi:acetylornithine deacetylase/succinyl-diaminopimelate desuccinylase-like protein
VGGALLLAAVLSGAAPDAGGELRAAVRSYRAAHEAEIVHELAGLLSIPNVASDRENIGRNAEAIVRAFERRGVRLELLRVADAPPAVYGELPAPGAKSTVIFYAHYDGQPVRPADWSGDPWKPVLRDGALRDGAKEVAWNDLPAPIPPEWRVYARSASDDKAPIIGLLAALDALKAAGRRATVNMKFFFEGEEEAGSPHLEALLRENAARLRADLWLLLDGPVHQTRRMSLYFGARGVQDLEITLFGPARPLHSGHYGNWAVNPIAALVTLLSGMRDDEGRIRVAGFSDDVRPLSDAEKRALGEAPRVDESLLDTFALGRTEGGGAALLEQIMLPALNLHGIAGGGVGPTATNSIPTEATASIDFRLVPDQTPAGVRERIEEHVRRQGYTIVHERPSAQALRAHARVAWLAWGAGYPASRTPMDLPVSRAVIRAAQEGSGGPIVALPMLGGSIPMYLFADLLKTPVIGVPIANHDNDQHAANENLRLQNLWDGIEVYAALMVRLAPLWKAGAGP